MYKWIRRFVVVLLIFSLILQPVIVYSASSPWSPTNSYTLSLSEKLSNTNFDTNTDSWQVAQSYILNDEFTTARSAGAVNGTSAEPTGGTRTVTDTGNYASLSSGLWTVAAGGVAWGQPGLNYASTSRTAGRLLVSEVTPSNTSSNIKMGFYQGVPSTSNLDVGIRVGITNSDLAASINNIQNVVGTYAGATSYKSASVLRAEGGFVFIKGGTFTNWTLLWLGTAGTTLQYPTFSSFNTTYTSDFIRIPTATWLPTPLAYDTFTRSDGAIGSTETTGPDSQTTPSLAWTGGAISGNKLVITPTLGSELLTNGDMETGNPPSSWIASLATLTTDTATPYSGLQSLIVTGAGASPRANQNITTAANAWYYVEGYAKSIGGITSRIQFFRVSSPYTTYSFPMTTNSTYTKLFGVGRTDTTDSRVAIYPVADTQVSYFDNISLKPLTLSSLFSTVPTSDSDVIADANVTLTSGTQAGLVLNLDSTSSPANFVIAYHDGTNVKLEKNVGGTYTTVQSTAVTYVPGATLRVIKDGTKYRVYYNNALVGSEQTISDAGIINNTTHGLFSTYSGNSFDNFTLWPRGTGGEFSALDFSDPTLTRDTGIKYTGTGSAKVVTSTNDANFVQSVNVGNTLTHTLSGYVYTNGGAVTSSDAELMAGNSTITTTYTDMGSGWYKLSGTVTGSASSTNYGVRVKANKTVYIDDMSLTAYPATESTTSSIFDTGWNSAYGALTFTSSVPANTTATVKVRTSNSSTMSGATDFSSCSGISSGTDISSNSCVTDGDRYVQYQVTLTSTTGTATATVSDVSIAFTNDSTSPTSPSLDSPDENSYTNNERPTFKWKVSTDDGSGMSKYTLAIDNGDIGDITIDNIPTASSLTTDKYVITYDSGGDGYISVYTKASTIWPTDQNNGKLKEGKRTWTVTAYDVAGNTSSSSRDIYIDYTPPTLTSTASDIQARVDGYDLINTQSPEFTGTVTDNLNIQKLTVSYYKENVLLGTVASEDLVDTETLTTNNKTSWNYTFKTSGTLDYGKYRVALTAYDKAGNVSNVNTYKLNLLTQEKINLLTDKKEKDTKTAFSIPELEKKALQKRTMEAEELNKLTDTLLSFLGAIKTPVTDFLDNLGNSIATTTDNARNFLASIQIPQYKLQMPKMPSINLPDLDKYTSKSQDLANNFNQPLNKLSSYLDNQIKQTSKSLATSVIKTTNEIENLNKNIFDKYEQENKKMKDKVAAVWQKEKISQAIKLVMIEIQKPVRKTDNFFQKVKISADTVYAIMFDNEPTKISDVTIEEIGEDYAIVSFKTNHYAYGKVNYGESLSYGQEIDLPIREKYHQARLTGLTKGKKYFFEVMAQNKNYAYDAYYVFEVTDK